MSHIALYRKYRPNSFSQVIGQNFVVQTLRSSIINNNISHAYIFSGSRGTGKTSIAKIFAKAINCLNPIDGDCCNECANCLSANSNNAIDVIELDAASNNGVNEIRNVIDTVSYLPSQFKYKVYIIDEAHMLSTSAWNALLKTIEEPPQHAIFIFATTEFNKIPITIISRCQRYDFYKLNLDQLKELIDKVCEHENILISNDAKTKIALLSDGGARDCLSILDQLSIFTNKNINIESINKVFGLIDTDLKIDLINTILKSDSKKVMDFLVKFKESNIDYLALVKDLISYALDKIVYLKTNNQNLLKVLTISDLFKIDSDESKLFKLIEQLNKTYENIKRFGNGQFYLEIELLKLTQNEFAPTLVTNQNIEVNEPKVEVKKVEEIIVQPVESKPEPITSVFNNLNQDNYESISLDNVFKTTTVTNKYIQNKPIEIQPQTVVDSVEESTNSEENDDFAIRYDDRDNFNHLVNENIRPINPYLDKDIIKQINEQETKTKVPQEDWQTIFFQVAKNNDKDLKTQANNVLEMVKNKPNVYSEESKILVEADKVLIASNNAYILLFNFKNEAKKFNQLFWTKEGYSKFKAMLLENKDRLIYAVDKKTAKEWTEEYRNKRFESFDDVNLDIIKSIKTQSSAEIKQNILDILGSTVKIKI